MSIMISNTRHMNSMSQKSKQIDNTQSLLIQSQSQNTYKSSDMIPLNQINSNCESITDTKIGSKLDNNVNPRNSLNNIINCNTKPQDFENRIPTLKKPICSLMKLFPGYFYLIIKKSYQGKSDFQQKRYFESTNTLHRDIHSLMKLSGQNLVSRVKDLQSELTINEEETSMNNQSKNKILVLNKETQQIEVCKGKRKTHKASDINDMLINDWKPSRVNATLQEQEPDFGHYLLFEFDENHLVSKIEYFGRDKPCLESFQNLFGLHRTFFNQMFERKESGLVEDFAEFINQKWARFLCHSQFKKFKSMIHEVFMISCTKYNLNPQSLQMAFAQVLRTTLEDSLVDQNNSNTIEKEKKFESNTTNEVHTKEDISGLQEDKENVEIDRLLLKEEVAFKKVLEKMPAEFLLELKHQVKECSLNFKNLLNNR